MSLTSYQAAPPRVLIMRSKLSEANSNSDRARAPALFFRTGKRSLTKSSIASIDDQTGELEIGRVHQTLIVQFQFWNRREPQKRQRHEWRVQSRAEFHGCRI